MRVYPPSIECGGNISYQWRILAGKMIKGNGGFSIAAGFSDTLVCGGACRSSGRGTGGCGKVIRTGWVDLGEDGK